MDNHNLYARLAAQFPADPAAVAIETETGAYTYADIEHASACLANLLASLGLPPGARVAAQVEKSPEALLLYLATLRAGLVYLPLNTAYRASELTYFIQDATPAVLVCASANLPLIQQALDQAGAQATLFTLDDDRTGSLLTQAAALAQTFHTVQQQGSELAAILYTSGTTGRSKGAMLSHDNLYANAATLKAYWHWRSDDVLLHMLPIFHVHGLFVGANGALLAGARMLWLPRLDIDQALAWLPRATVMMGVPTYYVRLLADPRFDAERCKQIRLFISGSAPLLADTFDQFLARTGKPILERYGMSETNMLASNPYLEQDGPRLAGTVGRALPGVDIRIADDADQVLATGAIGHIQVRGPNVFSGYWQMPEKTEESFTADGWFRTGDVGRFGSSDGSVPAAYLSIVGRSKDLIITGGYNVYPKEIELELDTLPGVMESAVFGVPHADFGEAVMAVVVARSEGDAPDTTALLMALKLRLANYKVPKRIDVIDALPRNTMGKVQKNLLRERYA